MASLDIKITSKNDINNSNKKKDIKKKKKKETKSVEIIKNDQQQINITETINNKDCVNKNIDVENNNSTENDINNKNKFDNIRKKSVIFKNAELVVEPLVFKEKLQMWKGAIHYAQEKKKDEIEFQKQRKNISENVKLAYNIKKEEIMKEKMYLEQLKKDEELAKQIENELNSEIKNELNEIEKNDYLLALELQEKNCASPFKKKNNFMMNLPFTGSKFKIKKSSSIENESNKSSSPKKKILAQSIKEKFKKIFKKKQSS